MSNDVDAYIAALEPFRRERMTTLRSLINKIAPGVAERIEWRMPVFGSDDVWVALASQKSYISVYLRCDESAAAVIASDPKLKGGKSCINISDKAALPLAALAPAIRTALKI